MRIASFFAGAGGLDLGFEQAGFDVVWANEFDKGIWATYRRNHPKTHLDERSITDIKPEDIGSGIDGMIGGPPCQSWSLGGAMRGLEDPRGQLFYDYIRLVSAIKPKFFLAENVSGIISQKFAATFEGIKSKFAELGYVICAQLFNAMSRSFFCMHYLQGYL
jgi:DNA (cytosine-5)-methyltransferase 1